jgi:hypothetical protein
MMKQDRRPAGLSRRNFLSATASSAAGAADESICTGADDRFLYVSCWGTGEMRQYDVTQTRVSVTCIIVSPRAVCFLAAQAFSLSHGIFQPKVNRCRIMLRSNSANAPQTEGLRSPAPWPVAPPAPRGAHGS